VSLALNLLEISCDRGCTIAVALLLIKISHSQEVHAKHNVFDIGEHTICFFRHSSADSKSGNGRLITSGPDGIGNAP
jgi:hypothetical protein